MTRMNMRTTRKTFLSAVLTLCTMGAMAQTFTIIDGNVITCTGAILDSGGEGASGYTNGEDFVLQLCPDQPGNAINLDFVTFTLSQAGSAPTDRLMIYDGDDTNAPLLGTWNGSDSPGVVSASFDNPTGCLTLHFISNEVGTGVFAAYITCYTPCQPPIANAVMQGLTVPALVCQNQPITFDGSASTAAPGFEIAEYRWFFDDGSVDSTSGAVVTHSFSDPGEYIVQLQLTDNSAAGCINTNLVDLQLLVSTTPDFTAALLLDTTICQGATYLLNATGVAPTEWSAIPIIDFGEGIYLPDDQSMPFISPITFQGFTPGAILANVDDLVSICVDMEHSYMGDLVISIICPNGQQTILHQQGGGGTFIGDALDTEEVPPVPGTCLTYCWTNDATNGTFGESSAGGATPNVQPSTVTPGSSVLVPGDYSSVEPLNQLVGCPLNGTWTFRVADLFGIDDGFICSWQLQFDPSLYPELTTYTPELGLDSPDSAYWSGPGVVVDPQNPLIATGTATQAGDFEYVFTVTDNFGCSYDTTITVTVDPAPQGPIFITGNSVVCNGGITQLSAPAGYTTYAWSNGAVGPNISAVPGTYTVSVSLGGCPLQSEPFTVTAAASPEPVITGPPSSCGGQPATLTTTESYVSYVWSTSSNAPSITVGSGNYSVTVTNDAGCSATSAPYEVVVGSNPQANFTVTPPSPQGIGATAVFTDASQGSGSPLTQWDWTFGIEGEGSTSQNTSFTYNAPGTYTVTLTVTAADGCDATSSAIYVILPEQIIIPNVFTPNGDSNNEYFVIENGQYYRNSLAVYNRWGQAVYEVSNYRNTWKATGVPDGTYYYVFKTADDGKEYTGHVTILR